jgi:hypothetical protein
VDDPNARWSTVGDDRWSVFWRCLTWTVRKISQVPRWPPACENRRGLGNADRLLNTFPHTSFSQNVGSGRRHCVKSRCLRGRRRHHPGMLPKMAVVIASRFLIFVLGGAGLADVRHGHTASASVHCGLAATVNGHTVKSLPGLVV